MGRTLASTLASTQGSAGGFHIGLFEGHFWIKHIQGNKVCCHVDYLALLVDEQLTPRHQVSRGGSGVPEGVRVMTFWAGSVVVCCLA